MQSSFTKLTALATLVLAVALAPSTAFALRTNETLAPNADGGGGGAVNNSFGNQRGTFRQDGFRNQRPAFDSNRPAVGPRGADRDIFAERAQEREARRAARLEERRQRRERARAERIAPGTPAGLPDNVRIIPRDRGDTVAVDRQTGEVTTLQGGQQAGQQTGQQTSQQQPLPPELQQALAGAQQQQLRELSRVLGIRDAVTGSGGGGRRLNELHYQER